MTLSALSPAFREALAYHWVIGAAFGIPTGDIFVAFDGPRPSRFQISVRDSGIDFRIDVANLDLSREDFERDWSAAVRAYNAATMAERTAMVESTRARERAVDLIAAMVTKGFDPTKKVQS